MAWAPDYVTTAELKAYVGFNDTDDDAELAGKITAASRAIDTHTDRQFGQVAAAELRRYTGRYDRRRGVWVVEIDDLQDVTGLAVLIAAAPVTPYTLEPVNALPKGKAWERLVVSRDSAVQPTGEANEVEITAKWGWSAVPPTVKEATKLQASRLFKRRESPYGMAGSPDSGTESRLLARVDPDVAAMLRRYLRWWAAR